MLGIFFRALYRHVLTAGVSGHNCRRLCAAPGSAVRPPPPATRAGTVALCAYCTGALPPLILLWSFLCSLASLLPFKGTLRDLNSLVLKVGN
jgi:hypothetical protein